MDLTSKVFESRVLRLINLLPKEKVERFLEFLVGETSPPFRLYPTLILPSRGEKKCFRYSLEQDGYIPSEQEVTETYSDLVSLGPEKYLILDRDGKLFQIDRSERKLIPKEDGKLFQIDRSERKLILEEVEKVVPLPNGYFFVKFVKKRHPSAVLLDGEFRTLKTFTDDLRRLCSDRSHLVLTKFDGLLSIKKTQLIFLNMKSGELLTVDLNLAVESAVILGDHLVCTSEDIPALISHLTAIDIRQLS